MDKAAIGERIRQERLCFNHGSKLSQDELAAAIGMCRNTVVNLENAKNKNLNIDTLEKVSQFFGRTEEYLLFGHDPVDESILLRQSDFKERLEEQRRRIVDEYENKIAELQKELESVKTVNAAYLDHIRTLKQINSRNNGEQTEND